MDICGPQEVQWRGQGIHFIRVEGRRYKVDGQKMMLGKRILV